MKKTSITYIIARFIASFVYLGYFPAFKGTVASLVAAYVLFNVPLPSLPIQLILIGLLTLVGIIASGYIVAKTQEHDPSWIVIDEVVGMWIAVLLVPKQANWYITAFLLFRVLDISKWCGVSYFEQFKGGWGIMLDDIAAGVITVGIMLVSTLIFGF